eukprot:scaffold99_cov193-Alexandrium_tamarense.AAC.4
MPPTSAPADAPTYLAGIPPLNPPGANPSIGNKSMCDDRFESCIEKSCKELPVSKDDLVGMDEEDIRN